MFKKILANLEEWLIVCLMGLATLLVFFAVIHRYMSGVSVPYLQDWLLSLRVGWIQELSIIMFVWMAKIGAAYGVKTGIHVGVDILVNRLQKKTRDTMVFLGLLGGIIFTGLLVYLGTDLVWKNGANFFFYSLLSQVPEDIYPGPISPDLELRTWLIYSAVPIGSALMCFRFIEVAIQYYQTKTMPHFSEIKNLEQQNAESTN